MKSSVNICNGRCHDELLWWPLLGRWHCHRFVCDYGRHPSLPQKDCNPAGRRNDIPRTAGDSQATLQKTAEWTCCLAHPAATADGHLGLSIAWGRNACVVGRGCPLACHELLEGEARMWIVCGHLAIPTAKDFCFFFFFFPECPSLRSRLPVHFVGNFLDGEWLAFFVTSSNSFLLPIATALDLSGLSLGQLELIQVPISEGQSDSNDMATSQLVSGEPGRKSGERREQELRAVGLIAKPATLRSPSCPSILLLHWLTIFFIFLCARYNHYSVNLKRE